MLRLSHTLIRNAICRTYVASTIISVFPSTFAGTGRSSDSSVNSKSFSSSTTRSIRTTFRGKMGGAQSVQTDLPESNSIERPNKVKLSEEEWKNKLTSEEFRICRRKGTESAWTGDFLDNKEKGVYYCSACGTDLFSSSSKFDSGSGWPSFFDVIKDEKTNIPNVEVLVDRTHGMERTEVLCGRCDSHLGHVFNDGPAPSGLRFCINSVSIKFRKDAKL